jgi:ribosomal protein L29
MLQPKRTKYRKAFKGSGQLTNTAQFGRVRREIARIKTILQERSSTSSAS